MGLEINLVSFIPLIMSSQYIIETEGALKYFLVQAFGSGIILFGIFSSILRCYISVYSDFFIYMVMLRLIVKLGIVPFHFWLPHVMGSCSWVRCILLSVVQKIAPIFLIFSLIQGYNYLLGFMAGLGSLIGGLGGLNQSQIRFILAYSSIGHISWIIISSIFSYSVFLLYFVFYRLINVLIMVVINFYNLNILSIFRFKNMSVFYFLGLGFVFMSLAGLPPFLGFYPKIIVINLGIYNVSFLIMFMLIFGSLINIFYYLNIFFNLFLNSYFREDRMVYKYS